MPSIQHFVPLAVRSVSLICAILAECNISRSAFAFSH